MRKNIALLASLSCVLGIGFSTPSMAASDLASRLAGHRLCSSDGGMADYGVDGTYVAGGTDAKGEPVGGHGTWSVKGDLITVIFAHHPASRVDRMTLRPDGSFNQVVIKGIHPNGERYAGGKFTVNICG
jgi:hypothetical protein